MYSAFSILNLEYAFLELLKLPKSIFFKRKVKFSFLQILTKFLSQIVKITVHEINL